MGMSIPPRIALSIGFGYTIPFVDKKPLYQTFIDNVRDRMRESVDVKTQTALASRAQMSQGFVSEILSGDSIPSLEIVERVAFALRCQPWELLADSEATRKAALERMILGSRVTDERAAEHLPPAPEKEAAAKRRKKDDDGANPS